jgi:hypothetical protein
VKYLVFVMLAGCGPRHYVVTWATSGTSATERIELEASGDGHYTSATDGAPEKDERVILDKDQFNELAEMFRAHRVCELTDDPAYVPVPGEGKTTLEVAFPDLHCKVTLWNYTWRQGRAKDISETMRSMRPLRVPRSR